MKNVTIGILVAVGFALAATPLKVQATSGINVGVLTCKQIPGKSINLIIHSVSAVDCVFSNAAGKEYYRGETGIGLGVDLQWNASKSISYAVLSAGSDLRMGTHSLAGRYAGGTASAALGIGTGVQVLIGGGNDSISLQPLAIEGSTGIGVAAGLGYLHLEPSR